MACGTVQSVRSDVPEHLAGDEIGYILATREAVSHGGAGDGRKEWGKPRALRMSLPADHDDARQLPHTLPSVPFHGLLEDVCPDDERETRVRELAREVLERPGRLSDEGV